MKKFIVLSIVLLMLAGFAITSSADDVTLYAGQIIDVGTLTVEIENYHLVVRYDITGSGWELLETHLYVGDVKPAKSAPGRFPYGPESDHIVIDEVYFVEYFIPLTDFGEADTLCIAAQAEIGKWILDNDELIYLEETAWAEGIQIRTGKNWAMYFEYEIIRLPPTISSEDLAGPFTKDELGYFDVTTVNPLCGFAYSNVLFRYTIEGILEGDITVFEYYDEDTTTWYKAPKIQDGPNVIGFFGPPTGFPMDVPYDETTTFRINIGIVGTFPVTITLNDLVDVAVLATLSEDVVVNPIIP